MRTSREVLLPSFPPLGLFWVLFLLQSRGGVDWTHLCTSRILFAPLFGGVIPITQHFVAIKPFPEVGTMFNTQENIRKKIKVVCLCVVMSTILGGEELKGLRL